MTDTPGRNSRATTDPLQHLRFTRTDADTFRTQRVSVDLKDAFFALLRENGIDPNTSTRPRDVPPDDYKDYRYAQAAFIGRDGGIVCDASVIEALQEKGLQPQVAGPGQGRETPG